MLLSPPRLQAQCLPERRVLAAVHPTTSRTMHGLSARSICRSVSEGPTWTDQACMDLRYSMGGRMAGATACKTQY